MTRVSHWEGEPVTVWASVWGVPRLDVHDVVSSTNDEARLLAEAGALPYTTVLAETQTAGRGRGGARWVDAPGQSLLCSVLLPVRGGGVATHLPLLVGLAAARAMEAAVDGVSAGIKWPNDVMLGGRKVCGILCEGGSRRVVAGVGINVRSAPGAFPDALRGRLTTLEEAAGTRVSRGVLATRLLAELRALIGDRDPVLGPDERADLARRDVLAGREVETHAGRGVARGITESGALLVETPSGETNAVVAGGVRLL